MAEKTPIQVAGIFDRNIISTSGTPTGYLVVEIDTGEVTEPTKRPPHNLAIVLDSSTAMDGRPIEAATRILKGLLEKLTALDCLSITTFSVKPTLKMPSTTMDKHGRKRAFSILENLKLAGNADLFAGWMAGSEQVALNMSKGDAHHRVILLSSGISNPGSPTPEEFANHSFELRKRGLHSTAIGLLDVSSKSIVNAARIAAIDDDAGEALATAQSPSDIVEILAQNPLELVPSAAEDLTLQFTNGQGLIFDSLDDLSNVGTALECKWKVGRVSANAETYRTFSVTSLSGEIGDTYELGANASWTDLMTGTQCAANSGEIILKIGSNDDVISQNIDYEACRKVAASMQTKIAKHLSELNRNRNFDEATKFLNTALQEFEEVVRGHPMERQILANLSQVVSATHRPWRS